jgi:hypothetical protein
LAPPPSAASTAEATARGAGESGDDCVAVALFATPTLPEAAAAQLAVELGAALAERYPDVCWEVELTVDPLADPPVHLTELVDAARSRLLEQDADLAIAVTELPLRLGRRPLLSHASPTHGVALVSLPALGPLRRDRRLLDAAADAVAVLVGDVPRDGTHRRLVELANDADEGQGVTFLARVLTGNVRLLLGMIRANRPWRLVARLSRALVGALAAAAYALVAFDVWRIAASLDGLRLAVVSVATIATAVAALIAVHDLWERAEDRRVREQVMLFNLATLATLTIGIVSLYLAVFVASLAGAALLIDSSLLASATHQHASAGDYLRLAWLASSLATVGGAVGAALESDTAVREAAYAHREEVS